jgi:hypothetical protein
MGKVYFTDGRSVELSPRDTKSFFMRMKEGGVRMVLTRDTDPQLVIVISACPVSYMELDTAHVPSPAVITEEKAAVLQEDATVKGGAAKEAEVLAEITARSNCKHEAEKMVLHKMDSATGVKYFNICSFCGYRTRFIAAATLSTEQKEAAVQYQEE